MALDAALRDLSDEYRLPVVLRDVADLDYAEIAAVLDIPAGTVQEPDRPRTSGAGQGPLTETPGTSRPTRNVQAGHHERRRTADARRNGQRLPRR